MMITPEKSQAALRSVQDLITAARKMANERLPYPQLAELLDQAEGLQGLVIEPLDRTQEFRGALQELCEDFGCHYVLQRFDSEG